jgi:glycine cleavage system aminomethyltransferase T
VRGLWYCVAIWVKDGPGYGKLIADWMTDGRTEIDHNSIDYSRFYPHQMTEEFIENRCYEAAQKIYFPAIHPREPYASSRGIKQSPFYEREVELGGHFMELGGWERAHGYASNAHLLEKFGDRVPVRENEWDNRHFWRVSNAEHLQLSEDCGIINLSHFHMVDVEGPDHVAMMEWLCAAKIGGDNNIGKGIYTHFLDDEGMVRADFTVIRMEDRCRLINGADAGPRDFHYMRRVAEDKGYRRHHYRCDREVHDHRHLGPNARETLKKVVADPAGLDIENFPFAAIKPIEIAGKTVSAFRLSYVGEQGWELHMKYEDGLAVWDALRSNRRHAGRCRDLCQFAPDGKEPAPAERRSLDPVQPD